MHPIKYTALALALALCLPIVAEGKAAKKVLQGQVNINTASLEEITLLPGIGLKKAEAIVAARTAKPFASCDELDAIKGVGPKMVEGFKPYCLVTGKTTAQLVKAEPAPAPVQ